MNDETRRWVGARIAAGVVAKTGGWFWLPCPICGEHFGGHEWRDIDGLPSAVPEPDLRGTFQGICPSCTRAGYGWPSDVAWEMWAA